MTSIRRQLLLWLLGGMIAGTTIAAITTYLKVHEEASELFDSQLREIAVSLPAGVAFAPLAPRDADPEEDIVVRIWGPGSQPIYDSQPDVVVPRAAGAGFSSIAAPEGRWRVYALQRGGQFVQVAQAESARDELAFSVALRSVAPFVALIPMLAALIGIVVGRALRALARVARALTSRSQDALQPLSIEGMPPEIRPMLDALNDLLQRLERSLEAQRVFVADAAHELRSPLAALKLQLELAERAEPGPRQAQAIAKLHGRLDRATHLVQQLLALAREEPQSARTPRQRLDLAGIARQVVVDLDDAADARGADLGLELRDSPTVTGSAEGLRALLVNLVENALRHAPRGGHVDVAVSRRGDTPVLQVIDDGPGIEPEERARIFDRFYRGRDAQGSGSGLGLAIVKRIVERDGAAIELAEAAGGRGLAVTVTFPPVKDAP
ncbi:MAG: ATP-binding protein [Burkholderiales bacterium]